MTLQRATVRVYRAVVRALPREFRSTYGAELVGTAEDLVQDAARRGGFRRLLLLTPRLIGDLLVRVAAEHCGDALRDLRNATRILARAPGVTAAAVLCLAIGIGLATAMYSMIRSTVLRPLPHVRDAATLVRIQRPVAFGTYEELRDRSDQFASLAAYLGPVPLVISREGAPGQRVWGHIATPDYFDVLGVGAIVGRVFESDERTPGSGQSAVISQRLWKSRFGGDPAIVGRAIRVNGELVTVIGVAPEEFVGPSPTNAAADVWLPTTARPSVAPELQTLLDRRTARFETIGRLREGLTFAQAEPALETLVRSLEEIHNDPGKDSKERRVRLMPGGRMLPIRDEDLPRAMGFPLVLVGLVLLMACGNVANMRLAQGASRRREMAVRRSLGAGQGRIVRQLLAESLMLSALGAAGGIGFAFALLASVDSMRPLIPSYGYYEAQFDWHALGLSVLLATVSGVVFGLAPAIRASRDDIQSALKPATPSRLRVARWISVRNVLVFQQVSVSIVLLLLTGFIVLGWQRTIGVKLGFDAEHLYLMTLDPVRDGYSGERAADFFERLPQRLERLPGVEGVSIAQTLPLAMSGNELALNAKVDFASGAKSLAATRIDRVGSAFFETVGIPLRRGRLFTSDEESDSSRVLVVNETMARQVWSGADPVGQSVDIGGETAQVVGVVADIRSALPLAPTLPAVYRPVTPSGYRSPSMHGVTVAVRTRPGFDAPTRLRQEIEAIDSELTVFQVKPMTQEIEQTMLLARVSTLVYGGMGVFGLVLSAVGLAGVTAYAVARRTHEIGIRMALGARRSHVLRLVLREGSAIVAAGTVVGLAAAMAVTRTLASALETLAEMTSASTSDPILLVGGPALLATLALVACYIPARRSTRIDPLKALRAE